MKLYVLLSYIFRNFLWKKIYIIKCGGLYLNLNFFYEFFLEGISCLFNFISSFIIRLVYKIKYIVILNMNFIKSLEDI